MFYIKALIIGVGLILLAILAVMGILAFIVSISSLPYGIYIFVGLIILLGGLSIGVAILS